jgi:Oxidoreductase family, NAD-binding Rossmann fold
VSGPYKYVVVGRGRWAPRIKSILASEGRTVTSLENVRRTAGEEEAAYHARIAAAFTASTAHIAWLCIPPGDHIPLLMAAAIESGLHVIVEKPWHCSREQTSRLEKLAHSHNAVLAIHYEYCLLDAVQNWRSNFNGGSELHFGGRLTIQRPNHIGLAALDNLGSHLFAIHQYSVPHAAIDEISCGYEQPDERRVWLESADRQIAEIDLLASKEPIIQRFIAQVEDTIRNRTDFPLDLQFALRVAERIALWRQRSGHKEYF